MTKILLLYVTAPDAASADEIAAALIESRLAACVNIIPGMRSLYRWQGAVEAAEEYVLVVKTTAEAAGEARALICDRHPYETPCVLALEARAEGSNPAFLDWIARETASARAP